MVENDGEMDLGRTVRQERFLEKLKKTTWEKMEMIAQVDVSQLPSSKV